MRVYLYSGMQKLIEKSGVGRAIYHQRYAARQNGIDLAEGIADADVVHINTVFPHSLIVAREARKKGIPVVYHAHSTKEDFRNSYLGSNLFSGAFGQWIRVCYRQGNIIVTPTEYSKKLLHSYGLKQKIEVVSNGIDLSYYDRKLAHGDWFRKKYGYCENDKVILSVGLTIARKGILDFVELAKRMPEYQFIWFGETDLHFVFGQVKEAVETKLSNLRFAGYAQKEELRDAYAGSDLFLFPSLEETEGIVVLEALAMKIPILLRDIPVYYGWLPADRAVYKAIRITDFELKAREILEGKLPDLTEAGYRVVAQRDLELVGSRLKEIYQECLDTV
ncbi:MAG: glycosyltransferase [Lachnospiraceae bacterium]|nr:glycosyltransferase [Lachnospiraceae bacterium]